MDNSEVARHWDGNSAGWIAGVRGGCDKYREYVNNPAFFSMLGSIEGMRIIDIGCGEGYNTRKLAERGASVVGVDISEKLIEAASELEAKQQLGIEYHQISGDDLSMFADKSFDAVVSTMALMDFGNLASCVAEAWRVLKDEGFFQFSVLHPCVNVSTFRWINNEKNKREVIEFGNYFNVEPVIPAGDIDQWWFSSMPEEKRKQYGKFKVPRFYRTISEYVNTLIGAGFEILQMVEPFASKEAAEKCPGVADTRTIPFFLIFRCRKKTTSHSA